MWKFLSFLLTWKLPLYIIPGIIWFFSLYHFLKNLDNYESPRKPFLQISILTTFYISLFTVLELGDEWLNSHAREQIIQSVSNCSDCQYKVESGSKIPSFELKFSNSIQDTDVDSYHEIFLVNDKSEFLLMRLGATKSPHHFLVFYNKYEYTSENNIGSIFAPTVRDQLIIEY